ncbi:F-box domain containing protein [Tanacetum coccineum]
MGSQNDKKRLDVEVDRLSSLPDDLIQKILSFNDTLDAIKTSTLSSRWRFIWTTMTCLALSSEDFPDLARFSKFVKHVLSGRDNQRDVSSVKLTFRRKASQVIVKKILAYAFSHNVQQLNITCLVESNIKFPLSLFSSQTLKHLILNKGYCNDRGGSMTLTSTWELPVLTTLHLNEITLSHDNTDNFGGLISKCVNLKNLTLTRCFMVGSNNIGVNIFHSRLSNLALEGVYWNARLLTVVAPQLKNLIIRIYAYGSSRIMISAPELVFLLLQCHDFLNFSADDFHSLEKADISFTLPYKEDPKNIVGLFQLLQSVKDLTLNMEILEHLFSSVEIISHQPSPFANLKSIKIYPLSVDMWKLPRETVTMSTEVKNYLLAGSPGATFTMVSREEIIAERNVTYAKQCMAMLQWYLERQKADIATNRAHIKVDNVPMESRNALMDDEQNALDENELQIEKNMEHINSFWQSLSEQIKGNVAHINSCWESLSKQIEEGKKKIDHIVHLLRIIRDYLNKLPASKKAEMQPCFSSLYAQADNVMSKIRHGMKTRYDEDHSRLNVCFDEFSSTLQSSS